MLTKETRSNPNRFDNKQNKEDEFNKKQVHKYTNKQNRIDHDVKLLRKNIIISLI
ncbi:hypothetical protein LEP1GSC040_0731 [Leptospira santarosai str. 2000030832]|nr:hypothetical protein LEP1GSC040_0731 [Leptospira santarosai str. 2000030832]